jgi:formate-dependent nitrite reductase cytochrome c552 subunit
MTLRGVAFASTVVALSATLVLGLLGCASDGIPKTPSADANAESCGGEDCHDANVVAMGGAKHKNLRCTACHEDAGEKHAADPEAVAAGTDWKIDSCARCHEGEAVTYLYDDNAQAGPFGGSIREPAQPKHDTFPEYKTIVAGHAFAREYNEEGAHAYMLRDHYDILRGKFEVCMQCKSTKVAYAWGTGKKLTVEADTEIELTHTATGTVPAKKVKIPAGTEITYATDPKTRQVDAKAVFPDGTSYTSRPQQSEDATANYNTLWASTVAATMETMPYGAGCNHCHDPHSGELRVVRKAMIESFEGKGGPKGTGGVNPYASEPVKSFEDASAGDQRILTCAQCHVEYTCGKSGVDGVDRDAYGWAKAKDLHELYSSQFDYAQDWKNAIIGQPLIKSQHPETELFWESAHYSVGASCSDCHMPDVKYGGESIKSHWFTSPYKYGNPQLFAQFAEKTGVNAASVNNPCERCHADRTQRGIAQQKQFFDQQAKVEKLLARSVNGLGAVPQDKRETPEYGMALEAHRRAHVLWENLAVSENSMGFHNFEEAMSSMKDAEKQAATAIGLESKLNGD